MFNLSSDKQSRTNENNDVSLGLLRRELAAANARMSQLDTDLADKIKRIELLLARISSLEEKENQNLYNKYFGNKPGCSNLNEKWNNPSDAGNQSSSIHCNHSISSQPCVHLCNFKLGCQTNHCCSAKHYDHQYPNLDYVLKVTEDLRTEVLSRKELILSSKVNSPLGPSLTDHPTFPPSSSTEQNDHQAPINSSLPVSPVSHVDDMDTSLSSTESILFNEENINLN